MVFNIHRQLRVPNDRTLDKFSWTLDRADGSVVCAGGREFDSEKEARSDIAQAKKSMKGATRCKVVTVDDST